MVERSKIMVDYSKFKRLKANRDKVKEKVKRNRIEQARTQQTKDNTELYNTLQTILKKQK